MMNLDKLISEINERFGEPFLPEGFVDAERRKDGFVIRIGPRDVYFDCEGNSTGAGTLMTGEWKIEKNEEL